MTSKERKKIRKSITKTGFWRDYNHDSPTSVDPGNGIYTEQWVSNVDNTRLTIEWDERTGEEEEDE